MHRSHIAAASLLAVSLSLCLGPTAWAAESVDPGTLTPEPPPGADCRDSGDVVRCQTTFDDSFTGTAFDAPCGTVYESRVDVRRGTRWYVDGLLVRRLVFQNGSGMFALSPEFDGPVVTWTAHSSWVNDDVDATMPEDSWATVNRGLQFQMKAPDGSPTFTYAGHDTPAGHTGAGDPSFFETEFIDELCAVLTDGATP